MTELTVDGTLSQQIAGLPPERRALLERLLREKGIDLETAVILRQDRTQESFPLSFGQERLWFLEQVEPAAGRYNMPVGLRLTGEVRVASLRAALDSALERHEALRTRFYAVDGEPRQQVTPCQGVPLQEVDLRHLGKDGAEAHARDLARAEASRPFDLGAPPLLRALLMRLTEDVWDLVLTVHHLAADGWSMGILVHDVIAAYMAHAAGHALDLPEPPIQYVDYAVWQRRRLQGQRLESLLAYWREQLAGGEATELPTDRPRTPGRAHRAGTWRIEIPGACLDALEALAREEGATLFMALLAVLQVLLHRYTGQERIAVGTVVANRQRAETERLVGFLVNTLVMRADISGNPTFRAFLGRVRQVALDAYAHEDAPFEAVVDAVRPARAADESPLFQVMMVLQNTPTAPLAVPGLRIEPLEVSLATARFDLTLSLARLDGGLQGVVEYDADLFDAATIRRLMGHFQSLLQAAAEAPDTPVGLLAMLSAEERERILTTWNDTRRDAGPFVPAHALIARQAAERPHATALWWNGQCLTYAALNARANRLAHYLIARGVGPGALVAVHAEPSFDLITGILATLKAGGAYLPLAPEYPAQRLAYIVEDARPRLVLTQGALARDVNYGAETLALDAAEGLLEAYPDTDPPSDVGPEDLAYVIYTSGSTGRPKGSLLVHAGLANLIVVGEALLGLDASSRVAQFSSSGFDVSVLDIVPTLAKGGTVVLVPREARYDAAELHRLYQEAGVTCATMPPAALALLSAEDLPALTTMVSGGETCPPEVARRWSRGRRFINGYGPTETTVVVTMFPVWEAEGLRTVPIGRPLPNVRAYVLDSLMQPAPIGVRGELYIGGGAVGAGYLNHPELTSERFVPDPYAPQPGARMYRTGDLVRLRPDGAIEFLGRLDDQVKIRGYRVELDEIAATLMEHPAVREATVVVREEPGERRLVAYVVPEAGAAVDASALATELRGWLRRLLPEYMLPAATVFLEALPLTPNGKVDRRALPAPEDAPREEGTCVAPRTPTEEIIAGIWADVLGVSRPGVDEAFFDLGGHSLLATRVMARVEAAFGVSLPLRTFFEDPTIASLASQVDAALRRGDAARPPIVRVPREEPLALSFAQQRLWFLDQLEPGTATYNIPQAVRIRGRVDLGALEEGLLVVISRHESLRTRFVAEDGQARQVIDAPPSTLRLPCDDLSALPPAEAEARAMALANAEARRPFDLANGPLWRARLVRLAPEEHLLVLTMHHIVSDGWSMTILVRELLAAYEAARAGREAPFPPLSIQYADYAAWQREWLQGETLEHQEAYWREQLQDLPAETELPLDRPRQPGQATRGAHLRFSLPAGLAERLLALGRQEGATAFMVFLAGLQGYLHRITGQEDLAVGTPVANRSMADTEPLIGFLVNTLVIRGDLRGQPTFREVLGRVREAALGAYAHQELPFDMVVDLLQPERNLGRTPLFQVMFLYQSATPALPTVEGLTIEPVEVDTGAAPFDLTVVFSETEAGLEAGVEYNADLWDASTIQRMMAGLVTFLEGAAAQPDAPVWQLPIMGDDERRTLLEVWNDTGCDQGPLHTIPALFEAGRDRAPDAVALVAPGEPPRVALTYAELDARANRLARHLLDLGVQRGDLVGLCLRRSPELAVGLLGITKAGGAFLPLDPTLPPERLRGILADARPRVIVSHSAVAETLAPSPEAATILLDTDWPTIIRHPASRAEVAVAPEDVAYVIYTSGSTGRPKGVVVSHAAVTNHNLAMLREFGLTTEDRVLQFSPVTFDAALEEILPTWCAGATLVLRPGAEIPTGEDLEDLARRERLTVLDLPTAYWHEWAAERAATARPFPATVRLVVVGGERASTEHLVAWRRSVGPGVRWLNTYGPTEAAIVATCYEPAEDETTWAERPIPIGRPIANLRTYVLDAHPQPVPVGVSGELFIGGAGVARGYLHRDDLSAQRFLPDPFSSAPGARMYRSGDRVRWRPDATLEFLGRLDAQLKIRGYRVEPAEVEHHLAAHPAVQQALVIARQERLVAFFTPRPDTPAPSPDALRAFLGQHLPDYMLPAHYVPLQAFPLTPNGKIDTRALPAPPSPTAPASPQGAPQGDVEETLAALWREVLGLEYVGRHDSFFRLGGDSILTLQIIARARQQGLLLSPRQFFEHPTVAGLAGVAQRARVLAAEEGPLEGPVPLTPIQRWFFQRVDAGLLPDPHHWNQSLLFAPRAPLDDDVLEGAVRVVVAHHDALRLRFTRGEDGWRQFYAPVEAPGGEWSPLERVDLRHLAPAEAIAAMEARCEELQASLDLANGPLLRVAHVRLPEGQGERLFVVVHHLAVDGVSWRILLEDLQTAYLRLAAGEPPHLPAKTTSYRQWAERLAAEAQSDRTQSELDYWRGLDTEVTPLPVDRPEGLNTEELAEGVTSGLTVEETSALLRDAPGAYHAEIDELLLAALGLALQQWTDGCAFLVDMEGHGREDLFEDVDLSRTVGWFTAIYPVRLGLPPTATSAHAVRAAKEALRGVPRRGMGYGLLRYLGTREAAEALATREPAAVALNYLGQADHAAPTDAPLVLAPEPRGRDRGQRGQLEHTLSIAASVHGGALEATWTFSGDRLRRESVQRLADGFAQALRGIVRDARAPEPASLAPSDFPLAQLDQRKLDAILARAAQRRQGS